MKYISSGTVELLKIDESGVVASTISNYEPNHFKDEQFSNNTYKIGSKHIRVK